MYDNQAKGFSGSYVGSVPSAVGIVGQTWNQATTESGSILDSASRDVNNAVDQLAELTNRARSIADAVFGVANEGKDSGGPMPPTSSKIDSLGRANANLFTVISALRNQIDRLTCL